MYSVIAGQSELDKGVMSQLFKKLLPLAKKLINPFNAIGHGQIYFDGIAVKISSKFDKRI